jgi:hypothetical protein
VAPNAYYGCGWARPRTTHQRPATKAKAQQYMPLQLERSSCELHQLLFLSNSLHLASDRAPRLARDGRRPNTAPRHYRVASLLSSDYVVRGSIDQSDWSSDDRLLPCVLGTLNSNSKSRAGCAPCAGALTRATH